MRRLIACWIVISVLLVGPVCAQMTFGLVPNGNSLVRSEDEAALFTHYLEGRLGEPVKVRMLATEGALYRGLRDQKIDFAVVSNMFYRERAGSLSLLANFSRSSGSTHKLLLIVSKNGRARSLSDLKRRRLNLVLDEESRSRFSFLTEVLRGDPKRIFRRIAVSSQVIDTLFGLTNGTYDAACVEDGLLETVKVFDPGLVRQVQVLKASDPLASDPIVARKGLSPDRVKKLKDTLTQMDRDSDGEQILMGLRITRFLPAVTSRSFYPRAVNAAEFRKSEAPPKEPAQKVEKVPAVAEEKEKQDKGVPTESAAVAEDTRATDGGPQNQADVEEGGAVEQPLEVGNAAGKEPERVGVETPGQEPTSRVTASAPERSQTSSPVESREGTVPIALVAVVAGALLLAGVLTLLRRRGRQKKSAPLTGKDVMEQVETKAKEGAAPDASRPEAEAEGIAERQVQENRMRASFGEPSPTGLCELRGELKSFRIPDLLQLMASCKNTGALKIQSQHDEKCLYFRNGKVSSAACLDKDNKNKLGSILVKLGKITDKERARALALCAEDPSKRLGNALVETGAVHKKDIQEALKIQAEEIVYSLFVFPEGHFEFVKEEPGIEPGEDLSLDVMGLLMEGARREDEWKNMRVAIPSIDIILKFAEGGRGKLEGMELTNDQRLTLSLVDGERSVREVCVGSTLVDFEVCDFLYRMMKLKVLEKSDILTNTKEKV